MMKKLLSSLLVIGAVLLSGIYLVGEMSEHEIRKIFARSEQGEFSSKLLSYDKQFLTASLSSQVTLTPEGGEPVVFIVSSAIQHYPHKATIATRVRLQDPVLAAKVQSYFGSENWLSSTEEISLLGKLTGQARLLPGRYRSAEEQVTTQALQLDYQVNLHSYSGTLNVNWPGLDAQTGKSKLSVEALNLTSNFAAAALAAEYDYLVEIAEVAIRQQGAQSQLQGVALQGSSRAGRQADTIDSSNDWKVASYRIADGSEKLFTDNHLKLDMQGLYYPALAALSRASGDPLLVEKALARLLAQGAQLSAGEFRSQTPWGKVLAELDITLQEGGSLSDIAANPFILLDYISGNGKLLLPDGLLQLPALSELLQIGVQVGLLQRQQQTLSLETKLEQGELTVNGRVIPL